MKTKTRLGLSNRRQLFAMHEIGCRVGCVAGEKRGLFILMSMFVACIKATLFFKAHFLIEQIMKKKVDK